MENTILTAEQIAELVANAVKNEQKAFEDKLSKLPSFQPEKPVEEKKSKDVFRKLYDGELTKAVIEKATNIEGTDNLGGYLVPQEAGTFIPNLNDYGLVRKNATIVNMNRDKLNMPYVSTDLVAYNINEVGTLTASNYIFGQVQLDTNKYAAIAPVSSELVMDSAYSLQSTILTSLTKQFSGAEDALFVSRLGSLGSLQTTSATATGSFNTTVSAGSGSFDVCFNMISQLESINMGYVQNATFIMSPSVYNVLSKVKSTTGEYLIKLEGKLPTIGGYPIVKSNKFGSATTSTAGTVVIGFGDLKNAYLGDRMSLDLYISRDGSVGSESMLEKDMIAYRGISRFDIQLDPKAFVVYKTV